MEISLACYRMKRLPISGKPSSVDDNDGCSQGLRSNSVTGSLAPSQTRPPCRPRHSLSCFILLVSSFRVRAAANGNSVRTKQALAAAKARGVQLGNAEQA